MARKRLLLALAHPDDESFGMAGSVAHYTNQNVEVYLICATDGGAGAADPHFLEGHDSLADLRLKELQCAADTLGLAEVILLGYRDSGMAGSLDNHHPGSLYSAKPEEVTRCIVEHVRRIRPHVVVTFDPFGGYGHPDHVVMHRAVTEAFFRSGDPQAYPGMLAPYLPQKLYYKTYDKRGLRLLVRLMPLFGQDPAHMGRNGDIDYREIAAHSYPIHARISTRHVARQAEQARSCHASQLGGLGPSFWQRLRRLLSGIYTDAYMRAYPAVAGRRLNERDLFAGVETDA
jgi:LmbE family N-acetylglucosaminyl deacetylase